jgi:hypothetical protein
MGKTLTFMFQKLFGILWGLTPLLAIYIVFIGNTTNYVFFSTIVYICGSNCHQLELSAGRLFIIFRPNWDIQI